MIEEATVDVDGAKLHVRAAGSGRPLLLLHGWPEFSLTWEPVMERLADRFRLVAPDLRGFGLSDLPADPFGPEQQAADMAALIGALDLGPVGVVAHDIGGAIAQALARAAPDRIAGLFFFDFIYPGIGNRFAAPERVDQLWYMFLNMTDLAPKLIGASEESVRLYITHFFEHWAHRPDAFAGVLDRFVAAYQRPGVLGASLAHYRAVAAERRAAMAGKAPVPAPIALSTCVRWAEHDPLFDFAWTDRMPEFFPEVDVALFPGVGHFPHREDPDGAAREIGSFFGRLEERGWKA